MTDHPDESKSNRAFRFSGFTFPHYTQIPDQLFDELMPMLSGAELKVLLYICRRTFGFKKQSDTISFRQMVRDIKTKEGKTLDKGTGLSKDSVAHTLNSLEAKNIIFRLRNQSEEKGDEATTYTLNSPTYPVSENRTRGGTENRTPPCLEIGHTRNSTTTNRWTTDRNNSRR